MQASRRPRDPAAAGRADRRQRHRRRGGRDAPREPAAGCPTAQRVRVQRADYRRRQDLAEPGHRLQPALRHPPHSSQAAWEGSTVSSAIS
ncbi:MAG: hypothetical protein MZV70_60970 [Desulfobacterales bacterium]|nr:hypothetical protein [Desulfobacterales bacterium]